MMPKRSGVFTNMSEEFVFLARACADIERSQARDGPGKISMTDSERREKREIPDLIYGNKVHACAFPARQ
ncbi:unnamed protein product [Lampetra planeri]